MCARKGRTKFWRVTKYCNLCRHPPCCGASPVGCWGSVHSVRSGDAFTPSSSNPRALVNTAAWRTTSVSRLTASPTSPICFSLQNPERLLSCPPWGVVESGFLHAKQDPASSWMGKGGAAVRDLVSSVVDVFDLANLNQDALLMSSREGGGWHRETGADATW